MKGSVIRALVFDVLGTVVDEDGTVLREAQSALANTDVPLSELDAFLIEWERGLAERMEAVRTQGAIWTDSDTLRRDVLSDLVRSRGWDVPESAVQNLAAVGHRLDPWPDSVEAIDKLARDRAVVALTNGSVSQIVQTFVHAGLRWSFVLSADMVQAFKPAPVMYQLPPRHLGIPAEQILFVAAHPWDLDAAAAQGYQTALIRRPGTDTSNDARFGFSSATIAELSDVLPELSER